MPKKLYYILFFTFCFCNKIIAQATESVSLTLPEAQQIFAKNNLSLLAEKYNIDIAKANIIQAKLYNNPNFSYSQELFSGEDKSFLNPAKEFGVQLSQLISIAGRYKNNIKLAEIGATLSETTFKDMLRTLQYALNQTYINLYIAQQKQKMYDIQIQSINTLIVATQTELRLGAIPKNDLIRLQTEKQSLQNNITQLYQQINDNQAQLNILLGNTQTVIINTSLPTNQTELPSLADIINTAKTNRPDALLAQQQIDYQNQNIKLQKSLATPDLALNIGYDKAAAYGINFFSMGAAWDLPVFNKNQGNIKMAKYQLNQAEANNTLLQNTLQHEVWGAYQDVLLNKNQLEKITSTYKNDLDDLIRFATQNYGKHIISLLDYLDQLRTYTNAQNDLLDLQSSYQKAIATLNFKTGTQIIK